MKNLDTLQQKKSEILQRINQAVKDGNEESFAAAFTEFTDILQEAVMAEARGLVQAADNTILQGRGVRALTSEETKYYEKIIEAMKSKSPQQALTLIDEAAADNGYRRRTGRHYRGASAPVKLTSEHWRPDRDLVSIYSTAGLPPMWEAVR